MSAERSRKTKSSIKKKPRKGKNSILYLLQRVRIVFDCNLFRVEKREKIKDMLQKYDEKLNLMKEYERSATKAIKDGSESGSEDEIGRCESQPRSQFLKFRRPDGGNETVVEVSSHLYEVTLDETVLRAL